MSENLNRPPSDATYDKPSIGRCACCNETKLAADLQVVFGIGTVCSDCRANGNAPRKDR